MSRGKTHYRKIPDGLVICGEKRKVLTTLYIELVTCKKCKGK